MPWRQWCDDMALIRVRAHRPEDLAAWEVWTRGDAAWACTGEFAAKCKEAMAVLETYVSRHPDGCYAGTSWGKDSTVLAHLVWAMRERAGLVVPLVWIRWEATLNPFCGLVRDAFLEQWPMEYHEHSVMWNDREDPEAVWGEALCAVESRFGAHWIGGMRADESKQRARRMARGLALERSCQPLGNWMARDVWAYLWAHDLPIHPAYAMTFGGSLDRDRIRVAALLRRETRRQPAGWRPELEERGTGHGRADWEAAYYGVPEANDESA